MIMTEKITLIDYPLDVLYLKDLAERKRASAELHHDNRYTKIFNEYMSVKINDDYVNKIISDFEITAKPKIYYQAPNYYLPMHIDNGTQCSLNFLISDDLAPITFEDGEFFYHQCLLNTQVKHSVLNTQKERILLKFSIFDKSYNEVLKTLKYVV
jgi:hypothetical protein